MAASGLLTPRLTTAQRLVIVNPALCLLVFDTDLDKFMVIKTEDVHDWESMFEPALGWSVRGNGGATPASNFLGTIDAQDLSVRTNNTGNYVTALGDLAGRYNTQDYVNVIGSFSADAPQAKSTTLTGDIFLKDPESNGGANTGNAITMQNGAKFIPGSGSPEGSVIAPIGFFYTRIDGGAGTTFYLKESGAGNTGWVAKKGNLFLFYQYF